MSAPFLWRKLFGDDTSATKLLSGLLSWSDKIPLAPGSASAGKALSSSYQTLGLTIFISPKSL